MSSAKPRNKTALIFQDTKFEVVDLDAEVWLRLPQIGAALGYESPYKVQQLFDRNADEFTEHMTQVIDLRTAGGVQKVRVFNLRGAYLIGILAKTDNAKAFRQWVLDILEGAVAPQETGRMTYPQRLAYLRERRWLARELAYCAEPGLAGELYENLQHVSRLLGITPRSLDVLSPGLKQKSLLVMS